MIGRTRHFLEWWAPRWTAIGPRGAGGLLVPVEVARGLLLEPEPVVLRRLLQEVRRLLEDVLFGLRGRRLIVDLEPRVLVVARGAGFLPAARSLVLDGRRDLVRFRGHRLLGRGG